MHIIVVRNGEDASALSFGCFALFLLTAGLSCFVDLEGMFSLGLFARDLRIFFDFGLATCSLIGEPELEVDSLLPGIAVFFRMRLPVGLLCPKHSIVEEAAAEFSSSGNVSTL